MQLTDLIYPFRKSEFLQGKDQQIQNNNNQILSEIQSLRSILLFKVGDLKATTKLYDLVPEASEALRSLEDQARQYFSGDKVCSILHTRITNS